jgi:tetratricopeptide (TPR) repeat protein
MLVRADLAIKDFTAARTATDDLKTLRPNGASGFYLGGLVAQAQGRPDDALAEFKRALELQPAALDALAGYARLQAGRGKVEDAVSRVQAVLDKDLHNAVVRNLLGELQLMQKSYSAATEQFAGAMADSPAWPVPYRNLAIAKIAAKDLAGGTAAYESGLKPTNYAPELVADLGALYERQGKADAAIALYEQLHLRDPQANFAANNLAMLLVTYRTDKASLERARQLTESFANSDSGSLLDTSGWVRFKTGDNQDALPLLERAANRAPDSRVIRFHLAMAQLQAGQHDKARDNLEVVLKDDTGFSGRDEARTALDNLKRRAG